jgi:hypothetical protein
VPAGAGNPEVASRIASGYCRERGENEVASGSLTAHMFVSTSNCIEL